MRTRLVLFTLCVIFIAAAVTVHTQSPGTITVHVDQPQGTIDPRIYGHFTELTLSSFEGSVWSELLFNRKFEIQEEREVNLPALLFTGAAAGWEPIALDTHVTLVQDTKVYYSPSCSQRITLADPTDVPAGIQQTGFRFVMPHVSRNQRIDDPFQLEPGQRYLVRIAIKSKDLNGAVHVALGESYERTAARLSFPVSQEKDWRVHTGVLVPAERVEKAKFMIYIDSPGTVWVDSPSLVLADLDDDGFRKDVIALTDRLRPTSIRWPGGWFVSDYHWRDGIGPIDQRPGRFNRLWLAYTTNDVGTDEFIELCRKVGAEPYISVNVGTGTPEEAAQWVEYCNGGPETEMGRLRAVNGHPEPYHVRDWCIGNEEYLPTLGGMSGRQYGRHFNAIAQAMRAVDPTITIAAVGAFDIPSGIINRTQPVWRFARFLPDWTQGVLSEAGSRIDYYSIHYYAPEDVAGHSPEEVNQAAVVIAEVLEGKLERLHKQMDQFAPGGKHYPIALDEWSLKVDNDPNPPQIPGGLTDPSQLGLYIGALTLREAVAEATVFNLMHRRPRDFALSSRTLLYAYLVGLIPNRRDRAFASPVALMMELYSTRATCQSLKSDVVSSRFSTVAMNPGFPNVKDAKHLNVSARVQPDGKTIDVFVVNRHLEQSIDATVQFSGGGVEPNVQAKILTAPSFLARNTFDEPEAVRIEAVQLRAVDNSLTFRFPAHSIIKLTLRRN